MALNGGADCLSIHVFAPYPAPPRVDQETVPSPVPKVLARHLWGACFQPKRLLCLLVSSQSRSSAMEQQSRSPSRNIVPTSSRRLVVDAFVLKSHAAQQVSATRLYAVSCRPTGLIILLYVVVGVSNCVRVYRHRQGGWLCDNACPRACVIRFCIHPRICNDRSE